MLFQSPQSNSDKFGIGKPAPVRLDWPAYFDQFCREHGNWYVQYGDMLLFQDGWMHSSVDYAGPEFPPPTDSKKLNELLTFYWTRRLEIITAEHDALKKHIESLAHLQAAKNVKLQESQLVFAHDEDGNIARDKNGMPMIHRNQFGVDWESKFERLKWLQNDTILCKENLKNLNKKESK